MLPATGGRPAAVLAATLSLLVLAGVGGGVLLSAGPPAPRPTAGARSPSESLPLRVPLPTPTIAARPRSHRVEAARPARSPRPVRPVRAASAVRPHRPDAAERDRELAAFVAGMTAGSGATSTDPQVADPQVAADPPPTDPATPPPVGTAGSTASFVLSSFNVLGSSHTRNGARGRAPGVVRIRGAAQLLARHGVDVAGFQELQQDQARELLRVTGGAYALYPGPGPGRDSDNSIGWRTSTWQLVSTSSLSVPYFEGRHRRMPVVLLRHRGSGMQAWFGNFHNPAETGQHHHQQRWRTEATRLEADLANRTSATGVPLFVTGDMNERASYFCRLTAAAPSMTAARGGVNGPGGCRAGRPRAVDWILGSRGVRFSGYDEDRTPLVDRTTDHPVVSTRVTLSSAAFPRAVG